MRRRQREKESKEFPSYQYATNVYLQVRELLKNNKLNEKNLLLLSKYDITQQSLDTGDAMIVWRGKPENLFEEIQLEILHLDKVFVNMDHSNSIIFYDRD
jgi:hypothetical protein